MAAYDIKKAVAKVGAKPMNFGFYKGEDSDQVMISAAPPTAAAIKEIEKECGKTTRVLKGVCFRDGDIVVFATKTAPAPQWKMQIAKVLKERKCQGVSKIELRQLGPGESEEVAPEDGGATDGVPGDGAKTGEASNPKGTVPTKGEVPTKEGVSAKDAQLPKALSAEWTSARNVAVRGVADLIGKLRAISDPRAAKAGEMAYQLAGGFPAGLGNALASFEKASASKDSKAIAVARAQAKAQADSCLAFLQANQQIIGLCENNPFGATVAISKPLTAALQAISSRLG